MKESAIRISIISVLGAVIMVAAFIFNIHTDSNAREFKEVKQEILLKVDKNRYEFDERRTQEQLTVIQEDVKKILTKLN